VPIFKLVMDAGKVETGRLMHAKFSSLKLEEHLENWLENSPWAIAQETLLIIGRQTTVSDGAYRRFPDLLAIDKDGFLTIIELKKGRTPREVVAQILEYASWAERLDDEDIASIARDYWQKIEGNSEKNLAQAFMDAFESDAPATFNQRQRLFIAAEEITDDVAGVCRYLRTSYGMDISCVSFTLYETESGEILIDSEKVVGMEDIEDPVNTQIPRWSGDKPVREVVHDAVMEFTEGKMDKIFAPKDIKELVLNKYPEFKSSTLGAQIIGDCVNHASRHHYPGGKDFYWWLDKGKYRLFDPTQDVVPSASSKK